jgi:hypothetical protein
MAEEPDVEACLRVVAPRLEAILKRHRCRYDFEALCEEIVHYIPDFNPEIFKGIPTSLLVANTMEYFDYKKTTLHEMRKEFTDFCKTFWSEINGEDAEEICVKIKKQLRPWNDENPEMQFPKINWLPTFGGAVTEQTPFPSYAQLTYMQEHNINYYLSGESVSFHRKQLNN